MKITIDGGVSKRILNIIATNKEVRAVTNKTGSSVFNTAQNQAQAIKKQKVSKNLHFKKATLGGKWGNTVIIWPVSKTAKSVNIDRIAKSYGLTLKRTARK